MGRLQNKVAVIVGAGSSGTGLSNGRAVSQLFAREGAKIFAVDRDVASLEETCRAVAGDGGTIRSAIVDITDARAVCAAIEQCVAQYEIINVLHNNVGIASTGGIASLSDEEWERVLDINLSGIRNTCRAILPVMERAGGGAIVNTSSLLSHLTLRKIQNVAYAVAKAGLEAMTRVIASEYADRGIRANNLILGLIDTPQVRGNYERRRTIPGNEQEADRIWWGRGQLAPIGRQGTPWEVAQAALFLASDESSYVTGTDLRIDGGLANLLD